MARQVQTFKLTDPKNLSTTIFMSVLLWKLVASDTLSECVSDYNVTVNNRTGLIDDKYKVSLQSLYNDLTTTSISTSLSFYNTTAGKTPYKSYAIYLCRGDTTSELCGSCVTNLTNWVIWTDSNCTERIAYTDLCMLRYANYSFFGKANDSAIVYMFEKSNPKIPIRYNQSHVGVDQVIRKAVYNSTNLFATYEAAADEGEKVYVLAQCTPDIGKDSCSGCLETARSHIQQRILGDPKFMWALLPSCQLRYDNVSFFEFVPVTTANLAPPPISAVVVATFCLFFNYWLL